MADDENKKPEEGKAGGKDDDDDKDKEPGCCFHYGQCLLNTFRKIYAAIMWFFTTLCNGCAYCWYPTKERCFEMCDCCGKRMNQH